MPESEQATSKRSAGKATSLRKAGLAITTLAGVFAVWCLLGDELTLPALAAREVELRAWQHNSPAVATLLAGLFYIVVTGLSLPGATVLTLLYGWWFGWKQGVVLVSFASTAGATIAFLLSRYLARDLIHAWYGDRLTRFHADFDREGAWYLFTLRLIPAVPFYVVNVVMALTPIRTATFWWVSQLAMLPATCVYVYAGASVPSLSSLASQGIGAAFTPVQQGRILLALLLLGLFPLVVRMVFRFWGRPEPDSACAPTTQTTPVNDPDH